MRSVHAGPVVTALILGAAGCVRWAPVTEPMPLAITHLRGDMPSLRLTLVDGEEIVLVHPEIRGDVVEGERVVDESRREPAPLPEAAGDHLHRSVISLSAIKRVERMQRDGGMTILAIAAGGVGLAAMVIMLPNLSPHRVDQGVDNGCSLSGCVHP